MKDFSLVFSVFLILCYVTIPHGMAVSYGLTENACDIERRLMYVCFHGSLAHLLINVYAFLSLIFMCGSDFTKFAISYVIAATIPSFILSDIPVVGLSAVNFALTGLLVTASKRMWWLVIINMLAIGATMVMPGVAFLTHLYCFVAGLCIGFLTTPRYVC